MFSSYKSIILQFGADSGGGSYKMWITPLVGDQPDRYIFCFLMFKGEENRHNVGVAMTLVCDEINKLRESRWKYVYFIFHP